MNESIALPKDGDKDSQKAEELEQLTLYCETCRCEINRIALPSYLTESMILTLASKLAKPHHDHMVDVHNVSARVGDNEINRYGTNDFVAGFKEVSPKLN